MQRCSRWRRCFACFTCDKELTQVTYKFYDERVFCRKHFRSYKKENPNKGTRSRRHDYD